MKSSFVLKADEVNLFGNKFSADSLKNIANGKDKIWDEENKELVVICQETRETFDRYFKI